jgi:hypothetical protein
MFSLYHWELHALQVHEQPVPRILAAAVGLANHVLPLAILCLRLTRLVPQFSEDACDVFYSFLHHQLQQYTTSD